MYVYMYRAFSYNIISKTKSYENKMKWKKRNVRYNCKIKRTFFTLEKERRRERKNELELFIVGRVQTKSDQERSRASVVLPRRCRINFQNEF